jgi:hypothetical protein
VLTRYAHRFRRNSEVERRTANGERRTSKVESRTSNVERRTSNVERRTSNVRVRQISVAPATARDISHPKPVVTEVDKKTWIIRSRERIQKRRDIGIKGASRSSGSSRGRRSRNADVKHSRGVCQARIRIHSVRPSRSSGQRDRSRPIKHPKAIEYKRRWNRCVVVGAGDVVSGRRLGTGLSKRAPASRSP